MRTARPHIPFCLNPLRGTIQRGLENLTGDAPDITNQDFVDWTRSIWHFPTESAERVGHPAPFPEELPRRLILLYTFPGDLVLDPFCGVGTTCLAVQQLGRRWVGVDIDGGYLRTARARQRPATGGAPVGLCMCSVGAPARCSSR